MKTAVEGFIGLLVFVTLIFVGVSYVVGQSVVGNARDFHGAVVRSLEDSDYDPVVVADCITLAISEGYVLTVDVNSIDGLTCILDGTKGISSSATECPSCGGNGIYDLGEKTGTVTLKYDVAIPLLGIHKEGVFEGNAK